MFQIESCAKQQKLCKVKVFQLQSMSKSIRCIDKRLAFKNSGISCMAWIYNLRNSRTTILRSYNWFKVARYDK